MDGRLRNWAASGHYADDEAASTAGADQLRRRPTTWGTTPLPAFLVPVGILCGALLAMACVARLLILPFVGRRGSG